MYHHQNHQKQGRAFGTALDDNSNRNADTAAALDGKTKKGNPFGAIDKRHTRSMTKRNPGGGGAAANKQPRHNAGNGNGGGGAVQRPSTAAMLTSVTSTALLVAPTSRPTAFSSISNFSSSYQHTGQVDNIDDRDKEDPLCATDYVQEMYNHFRGKEELTSARPTYMENQTHINELMRAILVDWLVEVHLKFKLVPETLYLTVNLIDRYLSVKEVERPNLQLVGVSCLLIASKYEEIYPPELRDLVYVCDRAYSGNEILDMEEAVLKALDYQVTIPSAHCFLVRYLKAAHGDKRIVQLACYLTDSSLTSYTLLHYLPSQLAAAAILVARKVVGRNPWSPTLLAYSGYTEEEILPVARALLAELKGSSPELRSVFKKYSSNRYGRVALNPLPSL